MPEGAGDGAVCVFMFVPGAAPEDIGACVEVFMFVPGAAPLFMAGMALVFMFVPGAAPDFAELIFACLSPCASAADLQAYFPCFVLP